MWHNLTGFRVFEQFTFGGHFQQGRGLLKTGSGAIFSQRDDVLTSN